MATPFSSVTDSDTFMTDSSNGLNGVAASMHAPQVSPSGPLPPTAGAVNPVLQLLERLTSADSYPVSRGATGLTMLCSRASHASHVNQAPKTYLRRSLILRLDCMCRY
ncbi:hypothetical protein M378DRAFT_658810 [Amanita muscaria Koide BX008]|uniref:Uncharacterized protein n=1 Tax=Amanita muscaria (strain Koide BX008) TaxID=946122 RepID=A0A0C2WEP1_AMAMK|nr:hypothetical protein M378DRAFT_658810 [Amanita muscaria Koide BX008]